MITPNQSPKMKRAATFATPTREMQATKPTSVTRTPDFNPRRSEFKRSYSLATPEIHHSPAPAFKRSNSLATPDLKLSPATLKRANTMGVETTTTDLTLNKLRGEDSPQSPRLRRATTIVASIATNLLENVGEEEEEEEEEDEDDPTKSPIRVNHEFLAKRYEQAVLQTPTLTRNNTAEVDFWGNITPTQTIQDTSKLPPPPETVKTWRLHPDASIFLTEPNTPYTTRNTHRQFMHWFEPPEEAFSDLWLSVVGPRMKKIVEKSSRKMPGPRKLTAYFVFRGNTFDKAQPTVVITCQTRETAEYVKRQLDSEDMQFILKMNKCDLKIGIDAIVPLVGHETPKGGSNSPYLESQASTPVKSPTLLPSDFPLPMSPSDHYHDADDEEDADDRFEIEALTNKESYRDDLRGMTMTVKSSKFKDGPRSATVGGLIVIDGRVYGMTANHAFDTKRMKRLDEEIMFKTDWTDSEISLHSAERISTHTKLRFFNWLEDHDEDETATEHDEKSTYNDDTDIDDGLAFESDTNSNYTETTDEMSLYSIDFKSRPATRRGSMDSSIAARNNARSMSGSVRSKASTAGGSSGLSEGMEKLISFAPGFDGDTEADKSVAFFHNMMEMRSKYDWAVVPFTKALAEVRFDACESAIDNIGLPPTRREVDCHTGSEGLMHGHISGNMAWQFNDGEWMDVLTVTFQEGDPKPGDSGSWVVDAQKRTLYGHLISASETLPISFVSPALPIFEEVASKLQTKTNRIHFPRIIHAHDPFVRHTHLPGFNRKNNAHKCDVCDYEERHRWRTMPKRRRETFTPRRPSPPRRRSTRRRSSNSSTESESDGLFSSCTIS